jgi:hypothetical protein
MAVSFPVTTISPFPFICFTQYYTGMSRILGKTEIVNTSKQEKKKNIYKRMVFVFN